MMLSEVRRDHIDVWTGSCRRTLNGIRALAHAAAAISLGVAIAVVSRAASAQDGKTGQPPVIAYRRVFVPSDAPSKWSTGNDKYLPVESRDFDAWTTDASRHVAFARIVKAEYQARFDGERLLDGHAIWKIEADGELPVILPLDELSFIVDSATWRDDTNTPARLGWWSLGIGKPLAYGLQITRSGELNVDWHTLKATNSDEHVEYPFHLPNAAASHFALDISASKMPTLSGAIVLSSEEFSSTTSTNLSGAKLAQAAPSDWRRWIWAVGGPTPLSLRIDDGPGIRPAGPPAATFHEDVRYYVTNQGLDVEFQLRCHADNSGPTELDLMLASGATIISVTAGDHPLAWHLVEGAAEDSKHVKVELPCSTNADDVTLVIKAWDTPVLNQSWGLPIVQVANAFWTSGSMTLTVDDNFRIESLATNGCTQSGIHRDEMAPGQPSILDFEPFAPTASVEMRLGTRPPSAQMRTATSLQIGGRTINGRIAAQLKVDRGDLQTVYATLQPGWTVDAVETIPSESLGQWHVDARDGVRRLEVRLNHAARWSDPLTMVVAGARQLDEPIESLSRAALEPLQWQNIEVEKNLLQLQTSGRYDLKPSPALSAISATDISDDDRQLSAAPDEGQWFDLSSSPPTANVGLTPTSVAYDAEIEYDATLRGDRLQQAYRVQCRPRGGGIDQVLVYYSEPLGTQPRWEDTLSHERISAERMPDNDPRLGGLPPGGELWNLRLRRLYACPFTLAATVDSIWTERRPVSLISIPDAVLQLGRASIQSTKDGNPAVAVQAMRPAPLPLISHSSSAHAEMARTCAIYRYEPVHFYQAGPIPRMWLGPVSAGLNVPDVVISHAKIDSFYVADGSGVHRAALYVQSTGARKLKLKLPDGVQLASVQLDSHSVPPSAIVTNGSDLQIALPDRFERGLLIVELRSAGAPLTGQPQIAAPLPANSIPILSGEWNLSVPREFAAVGRGIEPDANRSDPTQGLFGPRHVVVESSHSSAAGFGIRPNSVARPSGCRNPAPASADLHSI